VTRPVAGIHYLPSDKARAVVDAMERDVGTTLVTKVDLRDFATRADIVAVRGDIQGVRQDLAGVNQGIAALKQETRQEFVLVRQEIAALRQDVDAKFTLLRQELDTTRRLLSKDLEAMRSSIVIWLGSAIVVAAGVVFAAMRVF